MKTINISTSVDATDGAIRGSCKFSEYILLALLTVGSVIIVGWVLAYSRYGFDITDEGFYLVWIATPFIFDYSTTQFGYIYHPLYQLVSGNIIFLRQINIFITYGLGLILAYTLLSKISLGVISSNLHRYIISSGFATASLLTLIIAGGWLATPSYNTLAMQALVIVAIGLLLAEANYSRLSIIGWIAIGIGGWLAFMAKPTTAGLLAVCVTAYLALSWKIRIRTLLIIIAVVFVLLLASSFFIDGSLDKSLERLEVGLRFVDYLGGGYGFNHMLRLERIQFNNLEGSLLVCITLLIFFTANFISSKLKIVRAFGFLLVMALFIFALYVVFGFSHIKISIGPLQELLIWVIPFSGVLFVVTSRSYKFIFDITYVNWLRVAVFIVFPYIYVFGTNNNYWQASGPASYFWVISGLIVVAMTVRREKAILVLSVFAIVTQVFVVLRIQTGIEHPYRQPQSLYLNDYALGLGDAKAKLILEKGYGAYLKNAMATTVKTGFRPGTPIIDLSGQSPGLLYVLGATNIGSAWMIGGYPGSFKLAAASLERVPCSQLAQAWLLVEPQGPRGISEDLLKTFGANFVGQYQEVASWETSEGVGGYKEQRIQQLFKPLRGQLDAELACEKLRSSSLNKGSAAGS